MQTIVTFVACLIGAAFGSYDAAYTPYDLDQLYRMQLLANAFGMDDLVPEEKMLGGQSLPADYYDQDAPADMEEPLSYSGPEVEGEGPVYNDRFYSGAHLRDEEHLEQSSLHGYQSVSGGAGEVSPNPSKEVKSDKQLPEYCNPPNPCPVGKTAKDNCVEDFDNSAENNERLLRAQSCPCDTEHMFTCPSGSDTVSSKAQSSTNEQMALNKVLDDLAKIEQGTAMGNDKRLKIVSKKSPGHVIHKRSEIARHGNPYLRGEPKVMAAKKDPNMKTIFHSFEDEN